MASVTRTAPLDDMSKVAFDHMASADIARVSREYLHSVAAKTAQMSRDIFSKVMAKAPVFPFVAGVSASAAAVPAPNLELFGRAPSVPPSAAGVSADAAACPVAT